MNLFDASAQGVMCSEYSDSWMINYQPVYSCVTDVHPISHRVHGSTVISFASNCIKLNYSYDSE